jgi:hypothetical protein
VTTTPGPPVTQPCGTPAACRRHYRRGEKPCDACLAANRRQHAERHGHLAEAQTLDLREIRNGLPVRLYRYRGTGPYLYEEAS